MVLDTTFVTGLLCHSSECGYFSVLSLSLEALSAFRPFLLSMELLLSACALLGRSFFRMLRVSGLRMGSGWVACAQAKFRSLQRL